MTRRWASPAVYTPAGRDPGIRILPLFRSRQPMARTMARARSRMTPCSEETQETAFTSPSVSRSRTVQPQNTRIGRSLSLSSKRSANSGPVSSSSNSIRPKPLWMHCPSMPPRRSVAVVERGGHARGAASYHDRVERQLLHSRPFSAKEPRPCLVISSQPIPVSRISILRIL